MSEPDRPLMPLPPGPRHMRKRRFRREIPDQLLPGGRIVTKPVRRDQQAGMERQAAAPKSAEVAAQPLSPGASNGPAKKASLRTKRRVALFIVILVSASVPILVLSLILAG